MLYARPPRSGVFIFWRSARLPPDGHWVAGIGREPGVHVHVVDLTGEEELAAEDGSADRLQQGNADVTRRDNGKAHEDIVDAHAPEAAQAV